MWLQVLAHSPVSFINKHGVKVDWNVLFVRKPRIIMYDGKTSTFKHTGKKVKIFSRHPSFCQAIRKICISRNVIDTYSIMCFFFCNDNSNIKKAQIYLCHFCKFVESEAVDFFLTAFKFWSSALWYQSSNVADHRTELHSSYFYRSWQEMKTAFFSRKN